MGNNLGPYITVAVGFRGLNYYQYYFGAPYCNYNRKGPKTLIQLLRPGFKGQDPLRPGLSEANALRSLGVLRLPLPKFSGFYRG